MKKQLTQTWLLSYMSEKLTEKELLDAKERAIERDPTNAAFKALLDNNQQLMGFINMLLQGMIHQNTPPAPMDLTPIALLLREALANKK